MAYITRAHLTPGRIDGRFLASALDDNKDGTEDVGLLDAIIEGASKQIDAFLVRFNPPLTNPPAVVIEAAIVFTGFEVYRRKGYQDSPQNPFAKDREYFVTLLDGVRKGQIELAPGLSAKGKASASTEPMRSQCGGMLY